MSNLMNICSWCKTCCIRWTIERIQFNISKIRRVCFSKQSLSVYSGFHWPKSAHLSTQCLMGWRQINPVMWNLITAYNPLVCACVWACMSVHTNVLLATAVIHNTINNHFDFSPAVDQTDFLGNAATVNVYHVCQRRSITELELCAAGALTKSSVYSVHCWTLLLLHSRWNHVSCHIWTEVHTVTHCAFYWLFLPNTEDAWV